MSFKCVVQRGPEAGCRGEADGPEARPEGGSVGGDNRHSDLVLDALEQSHRSGPEVVHALGTTGEAILCFWVWTGDVSAPIWEIDDNGDRFYPRRLYE